MTVPAPDPVEIRESSLDVLEKLRLPVPASGFPLVWEPGDELALRPRAEIEARVAILNVVLARSFGMPPERAMEWLLDARLVEQLTGPEWRFVVSDKGDTMAFSLHLEAVFALAWVMGLTPDLDPLYPSVDDLTRRLPVLPQGERFNEWRARTLAAPRGAAEVAAMLDMYYCLDWAYLESERRRLPLPGQVDSNTIGQRRWALEWAVVFHGPYHDAPLTWEEIDLSV
ncbi:hypothetical protein Val02_80230 [Virgisporangium aliadipatigenens]|uniref:DUF4272 domain-containing protein n=1 Tax=Virgisporangium aliadipatigenens TaxID=741659 RepID=A0A8J3YUY2_9ACTN|nr:DUF4272 domain-containing protein [Virgisporangium aliadipatigenens]GIJ51137.1 hypothetical protein Val02_80230 [Virgisporangium aliadipatigenens]